MLSALERESRMARAMTSLIIACTAYNVPMEAFFPSATVSVSCLCFSGRQREDSSRSRIVRFAYRAIERKTTKRRELLFFGISPRIDGEFQYAVYLLWTLGAVSLSSCVQHFSDTFYFYVETSRTREKATMQDTGYRLAQGS